MLKKVLYNLAKRSPGEMEKIRFDLKNPSERSMLNSSFLFWLSISIMSLTVAVAFLSGHQFNF